jgi:hypothetical protein
MEELKMSVKDKLLQMETFTKVLAAMERKHGHAFTQKELNAEEPEYWKLRLARQMSDEYLDRQTGLGTGNIRSLRMAVAESPLEGSRNKVDDFPDLFNAVLGGREAATKVLNEVNDILLRQMGSLGAAEPAALPTMAAEEPSPQAAPSARVEAPASTMSPSGDPLERLESVGITVSRLDD